MIESLCLAAAMLAAQPSMPACGVGAHAVVESAAPRVTAKRKLPQRKHAASPRKKKSRS